MRHKWKHVVGSKSAKECINCNAKRYVRPIVRTSFNHKEYNSFETVVFINGKEYIHYTPECKNENLAINISN